jgi:lipoprotein-releasing system permease protein
MSEYDSNFIFVPLNELQRMRGMIDPQTGGRATAIQIRLHDETDGPLVRELVRREFPEGYYAIETWRDKQGPLLSAVAMQTAILNVLLFLIIAVAGFGILAIFCMIVAEKTRDIGILKSLGAPSRGILGVFLAYGLSLGIVGSGAGLLIGLALVANVNRVADALAKLLGHEVFDPSIYYFHEIPTIVEPLTVVCILSGAILIAVAASVVPAFRAARLHPVEALRHE